MDGEPVWLASLSRWNRDGSLATSRWGPAQIDSGTNALRKMLGECGDPSKERVFRMQLTLCIHRAANAAEKAALPEWFWSDPGIGIAGGPIEVLWESVPGKPSTRPCENAGRTWIDREREIWLPVDCGKCEPCHARALIGTYAPELSRL